MHLIKDIINLFAWIILITCGKLINPQVLNFHTTVNQTQIYMHRVEGLDKINICTLSGNKKALLPFLVFLVIIQLHVL